MKSQKKVMKPINKTKEWYTPKDLQGCALFNYDMPQSCWVVILADGTEVNLGRFNKSAKKAIKLLAIQALMRDSKYRLKNFEEFHDGVYD
jgi:hypothetical protein